MLIRFRKISTSTLSDVLDGLGKACVVQGLFRRSGTGRVAGFAHTIACEVGPLGAFSHGDFKVFPVFESSAANTVLVFDLGGAEVSTFGGLAALTVQNRGGAAAVIDGACRDLDELRDVGLTVASRHVTPVTGRGRMKIVGRDVPVRCGGITIKGGDLIVIDDTGIVSIEPADIPTVLAAAENIEKRDNDLAATISSKQPVDGV
ncbi:RraA family protein [Sphingomonas abietis]|uniref:Putative 4-hydroxy-4-methyl-2-oxoglutarate aldolase n=1 Tax=Sphingomonas abietis TaxID=3012344 RepID=A0ABY7NLY1_9SPHN|nr:RraA family protein [Sphingomonas abietis]WBO21980.1 RraA family protein [Sphingomonas abietis]